MKLDYKKNNKYIIYIFFLAVSLIFLTYIHPTFNIDEEYTMGLIQHSYRNLIKINMLDVHPFTYYVLLKFFLNITTFWTNNVVVKVMFGRLFSFVAFLLSFNILYKILKLSYVHIKWYYLFFLYLILCPISMYSTTLRMHEFSSLFNILEYFYLVKCDKSHNSHDLYLAGTFALIASYMDYFSAICAGIFLVIYFIKYLYKKYKYLYIRMFLMGILLLCLVMPLIILCLKQTQYRQHFISPESPSLLNVKTIIESFTQSSGTQSIIIGMPLFILLIFSFFNVNKTFKLRLLEVLFNYIITNLLAIVICSRINIYEYKFLFPQYSIYSFFLIAVLIIYLQKYSGSAFVIIIILMSLFMLTGYNNIVNYDLPSISFIHKINNIRYKKIYINYKYTPIYRNVSKQIYITQESIFLKGIKGKKYKLIVINGNDKKMSAIVNGKIKLFNAIFTNIKIK